MNEQRKAALGSVVKSIVGSAIVDECFVPLESLKLRGYFGTFGSLDLLHVINARRHEADNALKKAVTPQLKPPRYLNRHFLFSGWLHILDTLPHV